LLEFVPPGKREETKRLFDEIASIFGHFIAGQAFLCAIVGVIVWVALLPLHFSFSLLVAVICGLGYAVPFVGMIVAQVLAAVLAIPQGGAMVASVTVEIFVISRVADNLLVPKVMSQSVGVSPIGVMFAVFAGGELFGVPGLLLGIPAAAMVKVLFKFFVQPYILRMQLSDTGAADVPGLVADGDAKEVDVEIVVADASERAPDAQPSVVVGIRS
jgi:predicted PurR-regulated permease PerM